MQRIIEEFEKFINRGNVVDLAVGIILGASFTQIVNSIVKDIITPIIGMFIGGINVSGLAIKIGDAHITYGSFLQATLNFLIVAAVLFIIIKALNAAHIAAHAPDSAQAPKTTSEAKLLEEIRDLLKNRQAN